MKNKIYYFGIISLLVLFTGAMFKLLHWPAAGIIFTLGFTLFTLVFIPIALINSYNATKEKKKRVLYILAFICILIVCAGALFKIMQWPGATIFLVIGVPLPFILFLPAYLIFINKSKQINYTHLIFILFFFAYYGVITAFLSLNVSKDIISEALITSEHLEKKANLLDKQTDILINQSLLTKDDSLRLMNVQNKRNELNRLIDNLMSEFTKIVERDNSPIPNKNFNWWVVKGKDIKFPIREIFDNDIETLQKKIVDYKEYLLDITPENQKELSTYIQQLLKTDEDRWNGNTNVFNQPIAFVIQLLHQLKKNISIATYEAASAIEEKNTI
jgi:hypothetical protein